MTDPFAVHLPLPGAVRPLHFKNPVLTASGTFGFGVEFRGRTAPDSGR